MARLIPVMSTNFRRGGGGGRFFQGYGQDGILGPLASNVSPLVQAPQPAPIGSTGMPKIPAVVYDSPSTPGIATAGPMRGKRVGHSPNFEDSLQRGRDEKAAQRQRAATFVEARRQGILAARQAKQQSGEAPYDNRPQGIIPQPSTQPDGTVTATYPNTATARIVTGAAPTDAVNGETSKEYIDSENQRQRNVESQQKRGLGLSTADGGLFQHRPPRAGTAATPDTREVHEQQFEVPRGNYGLSQEELTQIDADARQKAFVNYQDTMANVDSDDRFANSARADAVVGAQADAARAKVLDATRERGAQRSPRETSLSELQKERQAAEMEGNTERAGEISAKIDERVGIPAKPTTQPAAQPSPTNAQASSAPDGTRLKAKEGFTIIKRGSGWVIESSGQPYKPS